MSIEVKIGDIVKILNNQNSRYVLESDIGKLVMVMKVSPKGNVSGWEVDSKTFKPLTKRKIIKNGKEIWNNLMIPCINLKDCVVLKKAELQKIPTEK